MFELKLVYTCKIHVSSAKGKPVCSVLYGMLLDLVVSPQNPKMKRFCCFERVSPVGEQAQYTLCIL